VAALSVPSSSGGMAGRARPAPPSAPRFLSSDLAAPPPATTTSAAGSRSNAVLSFSRSDSTTDCSKAAARSALSWSVTLWPRSRSRYRSAVLRPLKLYSSPGSEGLGSGWRLGSPFLARQAWAAGDGQEVDVVGLE